MKHGRRICFVTVAVLLACCRNSLALNPSLDITQYAHNAWLFREGFPTGSISSMTQTPDGYLWLGTEFGLWRFDGVRPARWHPPGADRLPEDRINALLAARDGTLWIGWHEGLSSWNGARLIRFPEFDGYNVSALLEDHEGTVWVGLSAAQSGRLCAIRNRKTRCFGENGELGRVYSLYEDAAGALWAGSDSGLWRWNPGPPVRYSGFAQPEVPLNVNATTGGPLLIATSRRLLQLVEGRISEYPVLGRGKSLSAFRLLRDRDGAIWIGSTGQGLYRMYRGRTDAFTGPDGLSSDSIQSLFEDREGNVWVATYRGLDRFREFSISTSARKQAFSNDHTQSVLPAKDGAVWLAGPSGLDRWDHGKITALRQSAGIPAFVQTLFQDPAGRIWAFSDSGTAYFEDGKFFPVKPPADGFVYSVVQDRRGGFWLAAARGLFRWQPGQQAELTPWSRVGQPRGATELVADPERGGVWVGGLAGVVYTRDGRVAEPYTPAQGLGQGRVSNLQLDRDGTLWAATAGGLSAIKQGRITTLTTRNGLPCDTVYWKMEDNDGATWLYGGCGLVRIPAGELNAWAAGRKQTIQTSVFEETDGVSRHAVPGSFSPRVAKDTDGKIWFVNLDGISVIDPRHLAFNKLPPPVHIESVTVDDKPHPLAPGMRLPANPHEVQIDYTALSFVAPEKVRFKYMLEGQDSGWHEPVSQRHVQYTNLRPREYRFRVIACNNSGVWNETGDTLEFSIAPAWNQATWFYASCVAAFLAMLWGLYRLRLYQIRREFNAQLDGRVDERLRVARELHDTMLQSFQAALIQMQAAYNIFTRRPEKTGESLQKAINTAAGAIVEGRSAIQDLRLHPAGGGDLAQLITTAGQELARSGEAPGNPPAFGVTVEGARRDVAPLIQDEVYRIARELLRNAFRHAQAGRIEVEIRYDSRQFRLHVRDDGKGIDSEVLRAGGRAGHYGLPGMRERANRFGGKLDFWSEAGTGTEAVLTVPGAVAYGGSNGGRFAFLRRKLWIHER